MEADTHPVGGCLLALIVQVELCGPATLVVEVARRTAQTSNSTVGSPVSEAAMKFVPLGEAQSVASRQTTTKQKLPVFVRSEGETPLAAPHGIGLTS